MFGVDIGVLNSQFVSKVVVKLLHILRALSLPANCWAVCLRPLFQTIVIWFWLLPWCFNQQNTEWSAADIWIWRWNYSLLIGTIWLRVGSFERGGQEVYFPCGFIRCIGVICSSLYLLCADLFLWSPLNHPHRACLPFKVQYCPLGQSSGYKSNCCLGQCISW